MNAPKTLLLSLFIIITTASNALAWCIAGKGNTCNGSTTSPLSSLSSRNEETRPADNPYAKAPYDGAREREAKAGDKSKNQGFSEHPNYSLSYSYLFLSTPSTDKLKKTASTANKRITFTHYFNSFLSYSIIYTDLAFEGGEGAEMKSKSYGGTVDIMVYITPNISLSAGYGTQFLIAVSRESDEDIDWNSDEKCRKIVNCGELMNVKVTYDIQSSIFVNAGSQTSIVSNENKNYGSTVYYISGGVYF